MPLNRIHRWGQLRQQRSLVCQGLTVDGQPGQQPTHGRGPTRTTGVKATNLVALESKLLFQQLFVFFRDGSRQANGCGSFGDDLRRLRKRLEPFRRKRRTREPCIVIDCRRFIAQALPDQLADSTITAAIIKNLLEQRTT